MAKEVRLVGEKGEQLGVMPVAQARELAKKQNLDLVEVAPAAAPPVCRILNYGKFRYQQAKREHDARKSQKKALQIKEIRLRPKIGDHDFESKVRSTKKMLGDGAKVKVTVFFRGREITHPEQGWKLLQRVAETVGEMAAPERQPVLFGKQMGITLVPSASQKTKAKEEIKEETKEAKHAKT